MPMFMFNGQLNCNTGDCVYARESKKITESHITQQTTSTLVTNNIVVIVYIRLIDSINCHGG